MNPTNAPPQPPPSATVNYLHFMESSARFRNSGSRGEEKSIHPSNHGSLVSAAASLSSSKLRLMCSNGGHIVPRPHDKSLRYIGGETRMVVVDRHTTLLDLTHRLSKTLLRVSSLPKETTGKGYSFTLKYQLPSQDLDSLISLTTDEDLENMIEEYERLNSSSRIRLFIFPTNPESVSSIGSFLENFVKSEDSFVSALNGINSGFSDTSSVNCLLSLDDDICLPKKTDVDHKGSIGTNLRGNNSGQDVRSIPDSPMMETSSSFGSASSTPSLANLPPIKENADDHQKVVRGIEVLRDNYNVSAVDVVVDPNDAPDQNAQPQIRNPACLLSMPTTQIDSPRNQLHHQQPRFIPPVQYIHHHPSGAVPVASYYHQTPMDQQNFVYYMPPGQLTQGYSFPLLQPRPSYDAPPAAASTQSGHQIQPQYVGYSENHQPSQLIYYAT